MFTSYQLILCQKMLMSINSIYYIAGYIIGIWQGFSDIQKSGQFVSLSSGKAPNYVHWMAGEPNNAHGVTEHCVTYIPYYKGWNDARCSTKEYFVCTKSKRTPCPSVGR